MLIIDKYAYTNRLKDFNPQAKFLIACGGLFIFRFINIDSLYIINICLMMAITLLVAKIPIKSYIRILLIPLVFLTLSILMVLISINDTNYILEVSLFRQKLGVTRESLIVCKNLLLGGVSSITSIFFFMLTTPMNQIIRVLKQLRCPDLFIELMILIYRSIFIFLDEVKNIDLGQRIKFGYDNKRNSIRSISLLIGNLLRKVIEKHREMNIALECKLYDGEFKIGG